MRSLFAALILSLFALPVAAAGEAVPTGQLPRTAVPLGYSLWFGADPQQAAFDGVTRIRIRLDAASEHLWLHGRDLRVSAVSWTAADGTQGSAQYTQVNDDGLARVDFGRQLAPQQIELTLRYSADYGKLEGLYKVTRGSDSYLVTQFEDIAARRAFPCFDEPSFKTPFDISLTVPEGAVAISNTRQIGDQREEPGSKTLRFATTEALPTYLVALAVGPWDVTKTALIPANEVRTQPLHLRVFGPRGSRAKLDYALKTTPALVAELERYFDIAYPFDKLDLLAAPDFAYGAMENAGLITFLERLLVLDEKSSFEALSDYHSTNAHELAHQWFGDYVTLAWWNDIWLNEAFASWMEAKALEKLRPDFRLDLQQILGTLGAMEEDGLVSARRIREPIRETADINLAFDSITYQKGAGVLSMYEHWLGADTFREGIRSFLRQHARGNAVSNDLIGALARSSGRGETLAASMRSFLDQPGIPLLRARLECAAGKKPAITLKQSRDLPLGSKGKPGAQWKVPVCLKLGRDGGSARQCVMLDKPEQRFELDHCPAWVMPNEAGSGYYRYTLPAADFARLNDQLAQLTPGEQIVQADALSAAFHRGDLGADAVLDALPRYAAAALPDVATYLLGDFKWILQQLASPAEANALRRYAIALYQPRLDALGYAPRSGESADDARLRSQLIDFLALDVASPSARQALEAIAQHLWKISAADTLALRSVHADLLATVLAVHAQAGGAPVVQRLMSELKTNRDPQQRVALLKALGAVTDPALAEQVRAFVLDTDLQLRERSTFYAAHKARSDNRAAFWQWAQNNFSRVAAPYPDFAQNRLPVVVGSELCSAAENAQLQKLLQPQLPKISGGKRALAQVTESIELCTALKTRNSGAALRQWVAKQVIPTAGL